MTKLASFRFRVCCNARLWKGRPRHVCQHVSQSGIRSAFHASEPEKFGLFALVCVTSVVWLSSRALLSTNFSLRCYCFVGNKRLLWTTAVADLLIGLSYLAISTTLAWLVRRAGDLPYSGFFWAFGLFIVSCGVTHFLEIVTVWKPVYWLSATAKVVTAGASVGTAIVLIVAADDIVDFVRTDNDSLTDGTILVADDEPALRHAIVEILRSSGYKVLEAKTSTQALEMALQHQGHDRHRHAGTARPGIISASRNQSSSGTIVCRSGCAQGLLEAHLPANATFLQEPFRFATLLQQLKLVRRRV